MTSGDDAEDIWRALDRVAFVTSDMMRQQRAGAATALDLGALRFAPFFNKAIQCWQRAIQRDEAPDLPTMLHYLGALVGCRHKVLHQLSDLNAAIAWCRCAIDLSPDSGTNKPAYLICLGLLCLTRFDLNDDLDDLLHTASSLRHALALFNPDPALTKQTQLATQVLARFEAVRESGLLGLAIATLPRRMPESIQRTLARAAIPDIIKFLTRLPGTLKVTALLAERLCHYLILRLQLDGGEDLDDALIAARCTVALVPEQHRTHDVALYTFGHDFLMRFESSGIQTDLYEAISHLHRYLSDRTHPVQISKHSWIHIICRAVSRGFDHLNNLDPPRRLLEMLHRAVDCTQGEHSSCSECMFMLGQAYFDAFLREGSEADIDAATVAFESALRASRTMTTLVGLSAALSASSRFFVEESDARRVLELQKEALELAICDVTIPLKDLASRYHCLGQVYYHLFEMLKDSADLSAGIEAFRIATVLDPAVKPRLVHFMLHDDAHEVETSDLDDAINILDCRTNLTEYYDRTPDRSEHRSDLTILARCLDYRYRRFGHAHDGERAIQAYKDAENLMDDDVYRLTALRSLNEFVSRHDIQSPGYRIALRERITLNSEALRVPYRGILSFQVAWERAMLCILWRSTVQSFGIPDDGFDIPDVDREEFSAYQTALDLLPQILFQRPTLSSRYKTLSTLNIIVRHPVSVAAERGDTIALQWFEQGRSIVWAQLRNLRTRLQTSQHLSLHEELTPEHQDIVRRLDQASSDLKDLVRRGTDAVAIRRLARERERALEESRTIAGVEKFLRPREIDDLLLACSAGTVVCINVHTADHNPCHAIICRNGDDMPIRIIPLAGLTKSKAQGWRHRLNSSLGLAPVRRDRKSGPANVRYTTQNVLRQIWVSVVKPIFDVLGIRPGNLPADGRLLPRITWCTTGVLAFLPLHAAGPYDSVGSPSAFDLVVSSYTPNIESILPRHAADLPKSRPRILVVAQADVHDYTPLHGARTEADCIRKLFPHDSTVLEGSAGTVAAVEEMMATHSYVHIASHGEQNSDDPLKSSFILADAGKLTLERLMANTSGIAEFAFLSACETATGDEAVPDEAVHLASGMLAVGYRSVVATMWSISDNLAPRVAETFYKELLLKDNTVDVARALHHAVAELRDRVGKEKFSLWAPYVHLGV